MKYLKHEFRMLFMDEGEDFGEEILVSHLVDKCVEIHRKKILEIHSQAKDNPITENWIGFKPYLK